MVSDNPSTKGATLHLIGSYQIPPLPWMVSLEAVARRHSAWFLVRARDRDDIPTGDYYAGLGRYRVSFYRYPLVDQREDAKERWQAHRDDSAA